MSSTELARRYGAKGLAWLARRGRRHGPLADRQVPGRERARPRWSREPARQPGDLILIVADTAERTADVLGRLRPELGGRLGLADQNVLAYCWVTDFPMYKWDDEHGRWDATHNPFSGVLPEDESCSRPPPATRPSRSPDDPAGRARAMQYDLALNGWELGGGSIRIHQRELLERSFRLQGYSLEGMDEKFGAVLEAFDYGAPPHGGIAMGIDRWAALFADQTNIREVMAFPKTQSGADLMLDAPSRARAGPVRRARPEVRRARPIVTEPATDGTGPSPAGRRPNWGNPPAARCDPCPSAAGRRGRCAVHRLLGDPRPRVGRLAVDGSRLPLPLRAAAARVPGLAGEPPLWPARAPDDLAVAALPVRSLPPT